MVLGILTIQIHLPGCSSLKEKRGRLKPLLARLHREFNVSAAEVDLQDVWQNAVLAVALVSNEKDHVQRVLQRVVVWLESSWLDVEVVDDHLELL
jgi:uncharacterized protein YlxP (DUF503 family)